MGSDPRAMADRGRATAVQMGAILVRAVRASPRRAAAVAAIAVAGLVIVVVASAGGGSDSLTLQALRPRASVVCTAAARRADLIPVPTAPSGVAAFLRSGVAALQPEVAGLRALVAPTDDAAVYRAALDALSGELRALGDTAHAVEGGSDPTVAIRTLQTELGTLERQQDEAWSSLEIPACLTQ